MDDDDLPVTCEALLAALHGEIAALESVKDAQRATIAARDAEEAKLGHHPNYTAYRNAGAVGAGVLGRAHILAHIGFHRLPYCDSIARLASAEERSGGPCLIMALRDACESDPLLETFGLAWLDEQGLLKAGAINPFWLKRPLLGLGQAAKLHGLEPHHAEAHRGLYAGSPKEMLERFRAVAGSAEDCFGDLLRAVLDDDPDLARRGAEAIERDAADRYWAKSESFAAHQRANGDRRWRWKPPLSRQGHLAVTTAGVREVAIPAERTRGHAANWLEDHGANPRFRKDPR